jgi:predicted AlkP superfamily pyrophosphatase or phosphodiesterase
MTCVLIMLDGLRPDAITPERTPHLTAFMQRGASTLKAQSVMPSITLPCHTSIFYSMPPQQHGITENIWQKPTPPAQGLVEHLHDHDKRTGFIYNWEPLRDLSPVGNLYFNFFINTGYDLDGDDIIAETAIPYGQRQAFDFTFIYFATIDVAGHLHDWMSERYLAQVARVDALVGRVIHAMPETTTVIIQADHGGHEQMHGTNRPEDITIPWLIAGPNIAKGKTITAPVSLLDTAPTIAHVLGLPPAPTWQGTVPAGIWTS